MGVLVRVDKCWEEDERLNERKVSNLVDELSGVK